MKKKKVIKKILLIVILLIIVGTSCFCIGKKVGLNTDISKTNTNIEEVKVEKRDISKTLTSSGEISTSKTEKLELSTSYYFESLCVEENDIVKKGEKLVKYTNGNYLVAPYDLVVTKVNVPTTKTKATSSNYIEVSNIKKLIVNLNINESEISNLNIGDEVDVVLTSNTSKKYVGKISKISAIGTYSTSGSIFPVEVSITNDGNIKIGMSVSCTINMDKIEDVLAIPIGAVQINGNKKSVFVVKNNEKIETEVTTGLSDANYVQIKSGLKEGDIVQVITVTTQSVIRSSNEKSNKPSMNGQMPNFDIGNRGEMPNNWPPSRGNKSDTNQ